MLTTSYSLLERLRQPEHDSAAWDRFVGLYTALLYRWAHRWGLQADDARDVTQDVLLVLFRELPSYRPSPHCRFRTWLWTITRNRARSVRRRRLPTLPDNNAWPEPLAPDHLAEQEAAEELALLTRRAAELLRNDFQPATWKAFWQTAVEGRSGKEVAQELGMTLGAVYVARCRVQQRIREELADFFD